MKAAFFDCTYGISGDMTLGALVDAGVPFDELKNALSGLPMSGYGMESNDVTRCGVRAKQITVHCEEKQPHRRLSDVLGIIDGSNLDVVVKERASAAFQRLAKAEAEVHQTSIEDVHFHEVGAVDAIVDIVGSMWCLARLGIEHVSASVISVGSGTVKAAHGVMPVPAPATALLLMGVPIAAGPVGGELTTPTGATIIRTVGKRFGHFKDLCVESIGCGTGTRQYSGHTNCLRVLIGSSPDEQPGMPLERRELTVLQTEIDDMSPELFGHVLEKLFSAGALDAYTVSIQMKKNRPAVSLSILCDPVNENQLAEIVFRETTTFGIKRFEVSRRALPRRMEKVVTQFGEISVKLGFWGDAVLKASPEYEDCRRAAKEHNVALAAVFAAANSEAQKLLRG